MLIKNEEHKYYKGLQLIGRGTPDWNISYMQNFIDIADAYDKQNTVPASTKEKINKLAKYSDALSFRTFSNCARFKTTNPSTAEFVFYDKYNQPIKSLVNFRMKNSSFIGVADFVSVGIEFKSGVDNNELIFETPRDGSVCSDLKNAFNNNIVTNVISDSTTVSQTVIIKNNMFVVKDYLKIAESINNKLYTAEGIDEQVAFINDTIKFINDKLTISNNQIDFINSKKATVNDYINNQENNDMVRASDVEAAQLNFSSVINDTSAIKNDLSTLVNELDTIKNVVKNSLTAYNNDVADENIADTKISGLENVRKLTSQSFFDELNTRVKTLLSTRDDISSKISDVLTNLTDMKLQNLNNTTDLGNFDTSVIDALFAKVTAVINNINTTIPQIVNIINSDNAAQINLKSLITSGTYNSIIDVLDSKVNAINISDLNVEQDSIDIIVSDLGTINPAIVNAKTQLSNILSDANLQSSNTDIVTQKITSIESRVATYEKRVDVSQNGPTYYSNIDNSLTTTDNGIISDTNTIDTTTIESDNAVMNTSLDGVKTRTDGVDEMLYKQSSANITDLKIKANNAYDGLVLAADKVTTVNNKSAAFDQATFDALDTKTQVLSDKISTTESNINGIKFDSMSAMAQKLYNEMKKTDLLLKMSKKLLSDHLELNNAASYFGNAEVTNNSRFETIKFTSNTSIAWSADMSGSIEVFAIAGGGAGGIYTWGSGGGAGEAYHNVIDLKTGYYDINVGAGGTAGLNDKSKGVYPSRGGDTTMVSSVDGSSVFECRGGAAGDYWSNKNALDGGSGAGKAPQGPYTTAGKADFRASANGPYYGNDGAINAGYSSGGGGGAGTVQWVEVVCL